MQIQLPSAADVASAVEIWGAADARLRVLLARYGAPGPALRHFGLVLWENGDLQSAAQALTAAAAQMPQDARVWNDLASVFHALGQPSEAAACAMESVARDPTQSRMWVQLGAIRHTLGDGPASVNAYKQALACDDSLIDAWVGLGLAYLSVKRFRDATPPLREAIQRGKATDPGVQACLGEALYATGEFAGAADAFAIAGAAAPNNAALCLKRVRAQFAVDVINGPIEAAVAACEQQPLPADDIAKTIRDGFHMLSAHGYRSAAIALGTFRLARTPDDRTQAYLLATLNGATMTRAPDDYIVAFFDGFADQFDAKLIDVLGYRVPRDLADLVHGVAEKNGRTISRILDLGCGTGLVGAQLTRPGRHLTGVDLSPRMLDKARQIGCYDSLVDSEVLAFLAQTSARYNLVTAADVTIYFGDLIPMFEGVARCLVASALFAFSIETSDDLEINHLTSGRFAHSLAYIERVSDETGFQIRDMRHTTIRLDAEGETRGAILVLSRI